MNKRNLTVLFIMYMLVFSLVAYDMSNIEHPSKITHYERKDFKENADLSYYLIESSQLYSDNWKVIQYIKKNTVLKECHLFESTDHYVLIGKKDCWINADSVGIQGSELLPEDILYNQLNPQFEWIATWYNEVIKCNGFDYIQIINEKVPMTKNLYVFDADCWWYEDSLFSYPCAVRFQNSYFQIKVSGWGLENFLVKKIKKIDNRYYLTCLSSTGYDFETYIGNIEYLERFPQVKENEEFVLILEQSGANLKLYNGQTAQLIVELMSVSLTWIEKLQKYFATGINTFKTVSTLSELKIMKTSDNLRLRSSGSTAGKPVVTIGKGTQVKVITVGAEQTIDNLISNWVQVEVQAGAKDRDGKPIAAGTVGWCFGGYLGE